MLPGCPAHCLPWDVGPTQPCMPDHFLPLLVCRAQPAPSARLSRSMCATAARGQPPQPVACRMAGPSKLMGAAAVAGSRGGWKLLRRGRQDQLHALPHAHLIAWGQLVACGRLRAQQDTSSSSTAEQHAAQQPAARNPKATDPKPHALQWAEQAFHAVKAAWWQPHVCSQLVTTGTQLLEPWGCTGLRLQQQQLLVTRRVWYSTCVFGSSCCFHACAGQGRGHAHGACGVLYGMHVLVQGAQHSSWHSAV